MDNCHGDMWHIKLEHVAMSDMSVMSDVGDVGAVGNESAAS
jgi:hypothetical protein